MTAREGQGSALADLAVLFELSLAIGESLDLQTTCDRFLSTLISRKDLAYSAVWVRQRHLPGASGPFAAGGALADHLALLYARPRAHVAAERLPSDYAGLARLAREEAFSVSYDDPEYARYASERALDPPGHVAFIRLGDLGFLKLHARGPGDRFDAGTLGRLSTLGRKLAVSLEGCLAHQRIVREVEERTRAEAALVETEQRLRTLVEHAPEAVLVVNADTGRFVEANANAVLLFSTPRDHLLDLGPVDLSPSHQPDGRESAQGYVRQLERALAGETPWFEWTHATLDGHAIACEVRLVMLPSSDERLVRASITDVRERRAAEEAQTRLLAVLENATDLVALSDVSGRTLYLNRAGREMLDFDLDSDLRSVLMVDFHPPSVARYLREVVLPIAADEGVWEGETELVGRTGRRIFGHQVVMAHRSAEGVVEYFSTIIRDITQRKRGEDALRKSEEQLAIMLDSIGDAVVVTDVHLRVTRMNPVAQKLTGWSIFDALGKAANDVVVLERTELDGSARRVKLEVDDLDGVVSVPSDARLTSASGSSLLVACSGAPMHGRDGETVGAVLVFRDVTEKRQTEERLRQAQKMEAVGQLAGGVAHDFNNLLSGIMGYAQLLHGSDRSSEQRDRFVEQILVACRRAADLTSQLLSFSRRAPAQSRRTDLHRIIEEVIGLLEHTIDPRIAIIRDFTDEPVSIVGDPSSLQNALLNLAVNARDAMPSGGILTFRTDVAFLDEEACRLHSGRIAPGRFVRVEVADTGVGIPDHIRDRIFEPFFTTKSIGAGTGLGLAAVYGTVDAHRGMIDVRTQVGEGTSFLLFLPLDVPDRARRESEPPLARPSTRGVGRILVVDDEDLVRVMTIHVLEGLGYEVVSASDGVAAAELFEEEHARIDLVLLDVMMPRLDGAGTLRRLRAIDPGVRVLVVSGFGDERARQELESLGVHGFLQKPFSVGDLSRVLARILTGQLAEAGY